MNCRFIAILTAAVAVFLVLPTAELSAAGAAVSNVTVETRATLAKDTKLRTLQVPLGEDITSPIDLPSATIFSVSTTVGIAAFRTGLGAPVHSGWIPIDKWNSAATLARKHRRPILVLEEPKNASDSRTKKLVRSYRTRKDFKGFVRVVRTSGQAVDSPELEAVLARAGEMFPDGDIPRIICVDTNSRIVGVVPSGARNSQLSKHAKAFVVSYRRLRVLDNAVLHADKLVCKGRYNSAAKLYERVAKNDVKGMFYPNLIAEKMVAINSSAEARLNKTEALLKEGKPRKATRVVEVIIKDGGDFEFMNRARDLRARIRQKKL